MLVKPKEMVDRDSEWTTLERFVDRRQRLAVVYGPRRVGKSFLLEAFCGAAGSRRYQAIAGLAATQLADFGRELGGWLGAGALSIDGWADALDRLARVDTPFVALDELPYLAEVAPELPSLLQRYVDAGEGLSLVLAGSSLSAMSDLIESRAPLYGRAAAIVVPAPLAGADLGALWNSRRSARHALDRRGPGRIARLPPAGRASGHRSRGVDRRGADGGRSPCSTPPKRTCPMSPNCRPCAAYTGRSWRRSPRGSGPSARSHGWPACPRGR